MKRDRIKENPKIRTIQKTDMNIGCSVTFKKG